FHDIVTGNNFRSGSLNQFPAAPGYDLCTGWGTPNGTNMMNALVPPASAPLILTNGYSIVAEGCAPANGVVDPGETVTVNFGLQNSGTLNPSNLVATLLATNGVTAPSNPQTYGLIADGGGSAIAAFSFTAAGGCGGTIAPTFQLQNAGTNLGKVSFSMTLGA